MTMMVTMMAVTMRVVMGTRKRREIHAATQDDEDMQLHPILSTAGLMTRLGGPLLPGREPPEPHLRL